jgi:uroporphyrin-III C-methyltransferase/precorrin-2 dehydrogenase/sirohydrochlorin ferrochelatase
MKQAFARARGFVSLVGAGPGDPELITRKGLARLRDADLVLYDALVSPALVQLAPRARRFSVGKRAGRPSMRQDTINRLMIKGAQRGQHVVRLKCGDPFVLGRGGEEALALRAAGIPFEIVPGVTSAVAAPALAGIPVTHRGVSSSFLVLAAHDEAAYGPLVDGLPPNHLTLVALMGLATSDALAQRLLARGWRSHTPIAVLCGVSTPQAWTWQGTLADLAEGRCPPATDAPGTIVIGEVVGLAALLNNAIETAAPRQAARI